MRRILDSISVILNLIADFIYAPLFRAHLREVALKAPLFPGQIWLLPRLGRVRVIGVTDSSVNYELLDAHDDENLYTSTRKDFFINCRGTEEPVEDNNMNGTIIPFNFSRKNE